jgi:NAD(P)-dependent dehydrogenase (short-subunit alcohol dehydrogenase family)
MTLDGRVALIAGATGGLGGVVAASLARQGARLGLLGTDASRLDTLVSGLGVSPDQCLPIVADLREADATADAVEQVVSRFGTVDVLAQLVGGYAGGTPLVELDPDELRSMLEQHVWTTFNLARFVVPHMTAAGWGRVVAVTAAATESPPARMAPYVSAKASQEAMLHSLSRDVAGQGVTVNVLAVKSIDVEYTGKPGWTSPEEIAATILWLCSDAASAVSGARIPLYGS